MNQGKRLEEIVNLITENGYITAKYLTEKLHYSTATINRDLNLLQSKGIIKRNYGGVELVKQHTEKLPFRYHKMHAEKNRLAKLASALVEDGDVIFIDGSTTTEFMSKYLTEKSNITVISNNIQLLSYLSDHGVNSICLGGRVCEPPAMLGGGLTLENLSHFCTDKMFFATVGVTFDGKILSSEYGYNYIKTAANNTKTVIYLVDHDKVVEPKNEFIACDFNDVDYVISDFDFACKEKYKNTKFIK